MKFLIQKILNKFIYRPCLKRKLKKVGSNFRIGYFSEILNPQFFEFGNNFYSGPFSFFGTNKNNPVVIGDFVMFGPKCTIQGGNHDLTYEGFMQKNKKIDHMSGVITMENGVWIGSNCTIISGANIGEGSIIGAMSLVNKKIPPFVVAGGVPVKIIKPRFKTKKQIENTLQSTDSKYALEEVLAIHQEIGFTYD
jgi:acetyltransferase-like isoleucine patch superfamily enzyme